MVFHLFYRGAPVRRDGGSMLRWIGLYLVQTLAEQYGGAVWISDNSPTGAVFHVQLPEAD
jgi:signal transduction histidine kinase